MKHKPLIRFLLDLGPLIAFFAAYKFVGIYAATGVIMVLTTLALGLGYWMEKRFSPMPVVSLVLVLLLGGMTLYLQDSTFIKLKPTFLFSAFAIILLGGLFFDRLIVKFLLSEAISLTEKGWRILTVRYAGFFAFLAMLNEIVWRNFPEDTWVSFKVWGILPLFFVFSLSQMRRFAAHEKKDGPPQD